MLVCHYPGYLIPRGEGVNTGLARISSLQMEPGDLLKLLLISRKQISVSLESCFAKMTQQYYIPLSPLTNLNSTLA